MWLLYASVSVLFEIEGPLVGREKSVRKAKY
jgi:hypothetical protein